MATMEEEGGGGGGGFPYWTSVRRRFDPDSAFFSSGNVERELLAKQVALDITEDERYQLQNLMQFVEAIKEKGESSPS